MNMYVNTFQMHVLPCSGDAAFMRTDEAKIFRNRSPHSELGISEMDHPIPNCYIIDEWSEYEL